MQPARTERERVMHRIPPGGIFDDPAEFMRRYQQAVQERDAVAAGAGRLESLPTPEVEGLSRRLSDVHLGGAGGLAPRRTLPAKGGSARLSSPAVRREDGYGSHSMRYDMHEGWQPPPPESTPSSPEAASGEASDDGPALVARGPRGAVGQSMRAPSSAALVDDRRGGIHSARYDPPAHQAPAQAGFREPDAPSTSTRPEHDWAPKRSGGVFSRLAKGAKKLLGKGNSSKHSGGSARHSLDSSVPSPSMFRMDSQSPGGGQPRRVHDEAIDTRVTQEPAQSQAAESPIVPSDSWPGWRFNPGTPLDDVSGPSYVHGAAIDAPAQAAAMGPGQAGGVASQQGAPAGWGRPPVAPSSGERGSPSWKPRAPRPKPDLTDTALLIAFAKTPTMQNLGTTNRDLHRSNLSYFASWLNAAGRGTLSARMAYPALLPGDIEECQRPSDAPQQVKMRLPLSVRNLQRAISNLEITAATLEDAVVEAKLSEFLDEYKASLLTQEKPLKPKDAEQYARKVREFDTWLAARAYGRMADYLPDRLQELRSHLWRCRAETPGQLPWEALERFLKAKAEAPPPAQVAGPQYSMPPAQVAKWMYGMLPIQVAVPQFDAPPQAVAPQPGHDFDVASQHGAPADRGSGRPPTAPSSGKRAAPASEPKPSKPKPQKADETLLLAFGNTPTMQKFGDANRRLHLRNLTHFAQWLSATGRGTLGARMTHPWLLPSDIDQCMRPSDIPFELHRLPSSVEYLQGAVRNHEITGAMLEEAALAVELNELMDEFKASLLTQKNPITAKSAVAYAQQAREFNAWLGTQAYGRMTDYLPDRLEELRSHLSKFMAAAPRKPPFQALDKFLKARSEAQPQVAEPQHGMAQAGAAYGHIFSPMQEPSGGWPYFHLDSPAPVGEAAGQFLPPRQTDSAVFGGLESLGSLPSLRGGPADLHQSQEDVTSAPRAMGTSSSRAAPEVIDLDDYEPQQREEQPLLPATVRLQGNGWLHDNDFIHYGEALASLINTEMGPAGWARFDERVGIVDPPLVRLLTGGTLRSPLRALHRHTAPILFLPVNNGRGDESGTHWSLLVVNRTAGMAFHYDSLTAPEWLDNPGYAAQVAREPQYRIAAEAARIILGEHAQPPVMASMPMQRDAHSCGDHVVTGMEILARRIVEGRDQDPIEMDLSGIRPDRARTIHMLSWHEQLGPRQPAARAAPEDRDTNSAPRKKRR